MRRIFHSKSGLAATSNGQSGVLQKESSRSKAVPSRLPPEIIKKIPIRSKKADASTSEEVNSPTLRNKREHWCPACPAAEHGVRCDTPPSGDENTVAKEVEKGVISPVKDMARVTHRQTQDNDVRDKQALDLDEAFRSVVAGAMKGADCGVVSVDKYTSRRSGLGVVDNLMHERGTKPPIKSKASQEPSRATSAPKIRPLSRSSQPEVQRMNSMRISRVPDRVFESQSESPRGSEGSSTSTESATPRVRAAYDRQRPPTLPPVKTHSRAHSFSEGLGSRASDRPPLHSPSFNSRKPLESPRTPRRELGTGTKNASEVPEKGHTKYSVAERFAKAFRGTAKVPSVKDGKGSVDADRLVANKTTLGQSKRMYVEHSDPSYDGSCSDTSMQTSDENVSLLNVLPLVKPGDVHSLSLRKEQGSTKEENALTWQEFVMDGRVPQVLLNDNPLPERIPEVNMSINHESSDSRRWLTTAPDEKTPRQQFVSSPKPEEKEREILKTWLEGLKRQSEGLNDDLELKARTAEQRLTLLNDEQSLADEQLDFLHELQIKDENGKGNLAAGINLMHQRIRRMHDEKKRLALEVASEVKRRITERAAAKEVLVMMKREMEACVRVMEKEKMGIQSGLERELERRENDWCSKLENIKLEEKWLRERVRRLEDEKGGLQAELAAVSLKESCLREKVRDFELQMDGHRKRVEGAEKTILDLRQSLVSSSQQARHAESELEIVRKAYIEKESQSRDLSSQVERLQRLCADQESSIQGLHQGLKDGARGSSDANMDPLRKELVRLSEVEKSLRVELESLRSETSSLYEENKALAERLGNVKMDADVGKFDRNLQAELMGLQVWTAELQDENNVLSGNLRNALAERDSGREVLKTLESNLLSVEKETKALQEEVGRERNKAQEKEREIHRLERRVDGLLKNNQMLQGILAMREKAAAISDEEVREKEKAVKEAHQLESEMRESLQVSARQLSFMNERAEIMNEKLQERDTQLAAAKNECGKKDEVIQSLEQSLGDLAKSVEAQSRRINLLTSKNAELYRHLQTRGKEVEDLHSKIVEDAESRKSSNQELDQISVQAHDVKQELEAQNLLCKLLRDKLSQREDDLMKRNEEVAALLRSRDWLQSELKRSQGALGEASQRFANLERTLRQKEELISSLKTEKDGHVRDLSKLREELPRAEHERDEIQVEAEEIGREALRLSAEVEVLRRKVAQLEEDVMVKEGQISILRGSFGGSE